MLNASHWKVKVNLYHLIQGLCDRPAYFWTYSRWRIPFQFKGLDHREAVSIDEAIAEDSGELIMLMIESGLVSPQAFCDAKPEDANQHLVRRSPVTDRLDSLSQAEFSLIQDIHVAGGDDHRSGMTLDAYDTKLLSSAIIKLGHRDKPCQPSGKITPQELHDWFGDTVPVEVFEILMSSDAQTTPEEIRTKITNIASTQAAHQIRLDIACRAFSPQLFNTHDGDDLTDADFAKRAYIRERLGPVVRALFPPE